VDVVELFRDEGAAEDCGKERYGKGNFTRTRHSTCHSISHHITYMVLPEQLATFDRMETKVELTTFTFMKGYRPKTLDRLYLVCIRYQT
jgi:hypothetical protein